MLLHRYDDSRLFLVLQTDHGHVAGLLAARWGNEVFAEPEAYASIVLAAQEHDCGWWNWEIRPTLNAEGFPPDYQRFWMGSAGVTEGSEERAQAWLAFYRDGIDWSETGWTCSWGPSRPRSPLPSGTTCTGRAAR